MITKTFDKELYIFLLNIYITSGYFVFRLLLVWFVSYAYSNILQMYMGVKCSAIMLLNFLEN